jgi:acetyl-CoA C-acetyltransferase
VSSWPAPSNCCNMASMHRCLRRSFSTSSKKHLKDVVIVGVARTPMGAFRGSMAPLAGPRLGALAIEEALKRANVEKEAVDEVYMGNVIPAGMMQAPDRQASLYAGIPTSVPCTMVNKVCASGMKAIMLAAGNLAMDRSKIAVAGGFESMSNVPYYLKRGETPYGGVNLVDGLTFDALTDVYNKFHMGNCGENTAKKLNITREEQDEYGINSYRRSAKAYEEGAIQPELVEVHIEQKRGKAPPLIVKEDAEFRKINFDKFTKLATVFQKEGGTVTAGNASTLSDGGAACVLMTEAEANARGLKPLARIVDYADGATDPIDFPLAPRFANDKLLKQVGMNAQDVDLWEINEAFSVVVLANMKLHELDPAKVNIHGGAVSLGHPLGASGARIVIHLANALQSGQKGIASICNGGGGASAIMLEKL